VQTCIWPSWCHCHPLSLAPVKSRLVLPFWYRLTWVVLDKGPLSGCIQKNLSEPPVKNRSILLEQSFTAYMPLLMATSTFGWGKRSQSSPLHCYLQCLHTLNKLLYLLTAILKNVVGGQHYGLGKYIPSFMYQTCVVIQTTTTTTATTTTTLI